MGFYLLSWRYSQPAMRALVEKPQDREAAGRKLVEGCGGKMHSFFFAFGERDGFAIAEFPDNESAAACGMTLAGSGTVASAEMTVLITPEEASRAMQRAHETSHGYTPPQS